MHMEKFAFFDFNGTLTQNNNSFDFLANRKNNSFKKNIYKWLGFIPLIRKLGIKTMAKQLKTKKITKQEIISESEKITLKENTTKTLNTLKNLGYTIVIISGGFYEVIEVALDTNIFLVDKIIANNLVYENDILVDIKINDCDFVGKKKTILNLTNNNEEVLINSIFVCNNFNDKSALKLPLKKFSLRKNLKNNNTISINSLSEILKFIK